MNLVSDSHHSRPVRQLKKLIEIESFLVQSCFRIDLEQKVKQVGALLV